ncbi:uncharacterized protein J4E92_002803 [Alternaria infectoria]|uniref:uncharacterized protein n=1 Tax=Alternaria infectoria TaxID=45303 RepID=UPI00221F0225|nr:uncharacterized protein J4E92_002803 [Alternaria infectoria]KAI4935512.1 hypothetical protein J4E92_002803 [Alternaria infectoria]
MEDPPFAWSYTCPEAGALQPCSNSTSRGFNPVRKAAKERDDPELLFLNGHPSSGWLNTIGHKYEVDMRFFQQHLRSIKPPVYQYADPSLPSSSRHFLKLSVPTIGTLSNALEDVFKARMLLAENLRDQLRENNIRTPPIGQPIIRRAYLHNRKQYTFLQEVSMCLLGGNGAWTVLIWTDAGGDDEDPDLSFLFKHASRKPQPDSELCPTVFNRSEWHDGPAPPPAASSKKRFTATQTFNSLHKEYGRSLNPQRMREHPFYAVSEIYAFAAAAEDQLLNMMKEIIDERMYALVKVDMQNEPSSKALSERINLQCDLSVLEERSDRISDIIAFLKAADDPVWFPPFANPTPNGPIMTARMNLLQDFQYLYTRIRQLIQRCERAMEIVAHNASLSEAKRSNSQSKNLEHLTRLTTGLTLVYVPLSFVCTFFGMNFSIFGQGDLPIWIFFAISVPVLLILLIILLWKLTSRSKKEAS